LKFTSRLNQLASDHNLMHFFVREKDCLSDAVRRSVLAWHRAGEAVGLVPCRDAVSPAGRRCCRSGVQLAMRSAQH
jgi:hypothetical protein